MFRSLEKTKVFKALGLTLLVVPIFIPATAFAVCTGGVEGQLEYETVANVYRYCDGTDWVNITSGGGGASSIDDLSDAVNEATSDNLFLGHNGGSFGSTDQRNVAIGANALNSLSGSNADDNIAIGWQAVQNNTSGSYNVGIGRRTMQQNTTANNNVGIGYDAGRYNKTGSQNVVIGAGAGVGVSNSSNYDNNVLIGYGTGALLESGSQYNVAVGSEAMPSLATGSHNILLGWHTLYNTTSASNNVAIGREVMWANVAKSHNTAVGFRTMLYANSSGTASSTYNTALGSQALEGSTTASANTGVENTALGSQALQGMTSGSNNVGIGFEAGDSITTGDDNIIIGSGVDIDSATNSDYLNIGNAILGEMGNTASSIDGGAALTIDGDLTMVDLTSSGNVVFSDYGAGTHTGDGKFALLVDATGNVIEEAVDESTYDPGTWTDITRVDANIVEEDNWQCRVDSMGQVFFKGVLRVTSAIASSTTIGVIPSACRPTSVIQYLILNGGTPSSAFIKFFQITTAGSFIASTGMFAYSYYPVTTITYARDP